MKHFTGYGAYLLFLALRTHFTNAKYDFFQMHGKLRATKESYIKRNDKSFFDKLARDYSCENLRDFYVANFLEDKHYVTELLDDTAERNYREYQRRRQSLTYIFTSELEGLFDSGTTRPFKFNDGEYPDIVNLYLRHILSPETLVIINDFIPFEDKFNKYLSDDILWSKVSLKLRKYKPFVHYDKDKVKSILKEKIHDTRGRSI
jgi:hypothetical protein